MKAQNPLFFLFKKLNWPVGLIIGAVIITSLGSISGLLIPLFTGKMVDKFSMSSVNWRTAVIFGSIFILNALLSSEFYSISIILILKKHTFNIFLNSIKY